MKKFIVFSLFIFLSVAVFAQRTITSVPAKSVVTLFTTSKGAVAWQIPVAEGKSLSLVWHEQSSSFVASEGIRTFVGYQNDRLTAVISVWGNSVSGNVFSEQGELRLTTSDEGFLCFEADSQPFSCGLCCSETPDDHSLHTRPRAVSTIVARNSSAKETKIFPDDNVLRVFRLALPVDYSIFQREFLSDVARVKAFWATAQATLNELYLRDVGIRFEVINDDRLICNLPEKEVFRQVSSNYVINNSTYEINKLIGSENYDMGLFITHSTGSHGLAYKSSGYFTKHKASATTISTQLYTIVHELGHLLGASHVHEQSGSSSNFSHKTETGLGQSVMGYGSPQNFFSLVSVNDIRTELLGLPHYVDKERTKLSGVKSVAPNYDNFPFGVKSSVREPKIDTLTARSRYLLPPNTFFGFRLKAMGTYSDNLLYMVQPADKAIQRVSRAKFYTYAPSVNSEFLFEEEYDNGGWLKTPFVTSVGNKHLFWVGVSTGKDIHKRVDEVVRYDTKAVEVQIVDAKPFRIDASSLKILYEAGERFTLRWQADPKVFQNTRVRILLSDDFGKTYKHTLAESTENDGECELVMPQTSFGSVPYKQNTRRVRAGVIKVEVIDHIAYAVSVINPLNERGQFAGGFELDAASSLRFTQTPEQRLVLPHGSEIPPRIDPKAVTTCRRGLKQEITYEETTLENTSEYERILTRKWLVQDNCGKEIGFTQFICIEKPVQKIDETEENTDENDGNEHSGEGNNNATNPKGDSDNQNNDTDNGNGASEGESNDPNSPKGDSDAQNNNPNNENGASGNESNEANSSEGISGGQNAGSGTQEGDFDLPKLSSEALQMVIYNGVATEIDSKNYFQITSGNVAYKQFELSVFNELGTMVFKKTFHSPQEVVFKGYANVSGVVGKGKRLPTGTYFYVLTCTDNAGGLFRKAGYLYVR
ncbi:reprolysin-like metallopeptidase [Capnocytophaga sp.]|uniref:reprolysin-like metallopeptidase n=1 Tax=Capnocytophaga sp. TaxID=44737 RepID=UPI0026DD2A71|nr:M12 family metallo-peptidase [Capnocytophaga sp.]MDO5105035.1 M12 family metallo-peptidase [Capnocytophaga sp.]